MDEDWKEAIEMAADLGVCFSEKEIREILGLPLIDDGEADEPIVVG